MVDIEFGIFLVPEGNTYGTLLYRARLSEELGYHSIWLSDHLHGLYSGPGAPHLECWTTYYRCGVSFLTLVPITIAC